MEIILGLVVYLIGAAVGYVICWRALHEPCHRWSSMGEKVFAYITGSLLWFITLPLLALALLLNNIRLLLRK